MQLRSWGLWGRGAAAPTCAHGSPCLSWKNTCHTEPHLLARCRFAHRSQGFARTAATSAPIFLAQPPPLPGPWPVPSEQGLTVCLTKPAVSAFPALSEERPGRNTAFCWHCRVRQLKFPLALGPRVRLLYGSPGLESFYKPGPTISVGGGQPLEGVLTKLPNLLRKHRDGRTTVTQPPAPAVVQPSPP